MTLLRLAAAGVRAWARLWWGLAAGAALTVALIGGALGVGDALRAALQRRVDARLGPVEVLTDAGEGSFRVDAAAEIAAATGADALAVLRLDGVASSEGAGRAVQLLGGPSDGAWGWPAVAPGEVRMSAAHQAALGVEVGATLPVRYEKPSLLPRDVALTQGDGRIVALRLKVGPPLDEAWPANAAFHADPQAPPTLIVDRDALARATGRPGRANLLLVRGTTAADVDAAWRAGWRPEDAGLSLSAAAPAEPAAAAHDAAFWTDLLGADDPAAVALAADAAAVSARRSQDQGELVLSTERVLLPTAVADAALAHPGAEGVLTWFFDRLDGPVGSASYGFVAAVGPRRAQALGLTAPQSGAPIAVDPTIAARLGVAVGDEVRLRWPMPGRGRAIREDAATFTLVATPAAPLDASWSPALEGITGRERCRDWSPGLPVDAGRITDADEAWWSAHGAAPKAVVALDEGQRRWENPFGPLTQVRWPEGTDADDVLAGLRARLRPADVGLVTTDLRAALAATTTPSNDFGVLFLGFESILLIGATLVTALVTGLVVEHRAADWGTLDALGWPRRRVLALVVTEAALTAAAGLVPGIALGVGVLAALHAGLATAWRAAADLDLPLTLTWSTWLTAVTVAWLTAVATAALAAARLLRARPRDLLLRRTGLGGADEAPARALPALAAVLALAAVAVPALAPADRSPATAGAFFAAGALGLTAGLLALRAALRRDPTGLRQRASRSLAVAGTVAGGVFLVLGVGLGAGQPGADPTSRAGGTGGYGWWIETMLPLVEPLADTARVPADAVEVLAARKVRGDDASCLQLGKARTPHLLGVDPEALARRGSFGDAPAGPCGDRRDGWCALQAPLPDGAVPAIGDTSTVTWGLHLGVGDRLTMTASDGAPYDVVIVGLIPPSVFQGSLLIDERRLLEHHPDDGGARVLLVDAPTVDPAHLARAVRDLGGDMVPAAERLARFAAVEHTYVQVFHAVGALGLLLGAVGVGLMVARNTAERRRELALLLAVGFTPARLTGLLVGEQVRLLTVGVVLGALTAALAAWPAVRDHHPDLRVPAVVVLGTWCVGVAAAWIAARRGIPREPAADLR